MLAVSSVLVVEDNKEAREFLTMLLNCHGVTTVNGARSGEEALALLERESFGAVICDYHLEGMNGLQFVQQFRARDQHTPVVILTGSLEPSLVEQVTRHPRVGFAAKPFEIADLAAQLDKLVAP